MTEMPLIAELHFFVGVTALFAGFGAFVLPKGSRPHRACGVTFVICMAALSMSGLYLSVTRSILFTVFLSLLAFHAVMTGWLTAKLAGRPARRFEWVGLIVIALTAAGGFVSGTAVAASPLGEQSGLPPIAFHILAGTACLPALLDLGVVLRGGVTGRQRIARHAWRMGFGLFIATVIFFFGNNHVLPEALRAPALLATPVALVILLTLAWLARIWLSPRAPGQRRQPD
tara:strand:- start:3051 stop:3737 length:687 start_codon:yes stop_codon:yes gene_type:complete